MSFTDPSNKYLKRLVAVPFTLSALLMVAFCNTPIASTARPHPHPTHSPRPTPVPSSTPSASPVPSPSPTPTSMPSPTASPTTSPTPTPSPTTSPTTPPPSPSPSPAPSSTNWSAPSNYPPYTWTPYAPSPNSVWNETITQNPSQPDPNGPKYTTTYSSGYNFFTQAISFGYANEQNQYQHPIYFGYASDPVYKISCQASWAKATCPTTSFHIPKYAVPAGGSDAHLGDIDYTYSPPVELDMWATPNLSGTGGTASPQSAVSSLLSGPGTNPTLGATGAGYDLWAGVVRAQELAASSASNYATINHALFLVTPCSSNSSVYPSISRSSDAYCANGAPYGARLRLNMTPAQIAALNVPFYHKAVLLAAATYGAYQGDNNNTGLNFQTEADEMYTSAGTPNPLVAWAKANGVPFNGTSYQIDISGDVPTSSWQWLLPPAQ